MKRRAIALILASFASCIFADSGLFRYPNGSAFSLVPVIGFGFFTLIALVMIQVLAGEIARKKCDLYAHRKKLEASERRNSALIQALPDYFVIIDRDGAYIDSSKSIRGITFNKFVGKTVYDFFEPADARILMEKVHSVLDGGGMRELELELEIDLDVPVGRKRLEFRIVALDHSQALYIVRDVTSRYRHEQELLSLIAEKEALIREIHHRVKNNLQVMSSLIAIQADLFRDEEDRALMGETQQRIHTLAQLHDIVYQSANLSSIDLRQYLTEIIDALMVAHSILPEQIRVDLAIAAVSASIETALSLGLIVNELVSNSFKYAFTGSRTGCVTVSLDRSGDSIVLSVSDDGCGLPSDFSYRDTKSLGWILIQSLVRQIKGIIDLLPGAGTAVRISVPYDE